MQVRAFGKTGESVSVLGFGAMRFETENGIIKEQEAVNLLRTAIDGGVNYIDTAYFYLDGQSEALVGTGRCGTDTWEKFISPPNRRFLRWRSRRISTPDPGRATRTS